MTFAIWKFNLEKENVTKNTHYIVQNALSISECQWITEYLQLKSRLSSVKRRDLLKGVSREYGDPLMEVLLKRLHETVESKIGLSLWPTLSFYYVYREGQTLARHRDRSSCEWVAGLCIGSDEEYEKENSGWPLILEIEGKPLPIKLSRGDLVIFKGAETWHWREAFQGNWYMSAIFAYVDKNGPFSYQKYDRRSSLGKPHVGMFRWAIGSAIDAWKRRRCGETLT